MSENGNRTFSRGMILPSRKTATVELPEAGCSVILRQISTAEWLELGPNDGIKQLAYSIVDEQGQRIFTTDDDLQALADLPSMIGKPLILAMIDLNGASKEAAEAISKNSEAGQSIASASV